MSIDLFPSLYLRLPGSKMPTESFGERKGGKKKAFSGRILTLSFLYESLFPDLSRRSTSIKTQAAMKTIFSIGKIFSEWQQRKGKLAGRLWSSFRYRLMKYACFHILCPFIVVSSKAAKYRNCLKVL
ncbi:hypothetical protein CEXT_150351 [Caerostris extrusa]|uniref:Uncharacterized protein n=1 Tax=Caerostris extrusa TaxID=172846 RepID=A0AAV4XEJ2_CAEEX|nr:hypothetical protein CEXT_150351 [Caerostris extrusa]